MKTTLYTIYTKKPLGPQVRKIRKEAGIRIGKLATQLELSQPHLSNFESDYHKWKSNYHLMIEYLNACGITHVFLDLKTEPHDLEMEF